MDVPQPGSTLGRYRIDRVLGQGGMGVVYAATDLRLGREVALKVITGPLAATEEYRRRFQHEALAMSRVQSPWIVQIHDHDEVDGLPYIVTQLVPGTDLGSLVAGEGRLTARRALRLCAQLARGLDDAHRAGVLHRDVKPGNVLIAGAGSEEEHAYLCDFGIALSDAASHRTQTGMVAGTWAYLAPERTLGAPAVPASDLYAVGCVLWTCLTGREPYTGSQVEMAVAHASAPVPQLPGGGDLVATLNRVLARVLAKDPADRHRDGAALAADLERLAATAPDAAVEAPTGRAASTAVRSAPTAPPPPPTAPPAPAAAPAPLPATEPRDADPSPPRRRRWPLVVGGVVAVALLAGAATWAGIAALDDDRADSRGGDPEVPELVAGDVDGDGLGDVAAQVRPFGSNGELWQALSTGTGLGPATAAGSESGRVLLGDVDGDGRTDQVWFTSPDDAGSFRVRVVSAGRASIWEHEEQLTAVRRWDDLVPYLADVDGDGRSDLLVGSRALEDTDDERSTVTVHVARSIDRDGEAAFDELEQVLDLGRSEHPVTGVGDFDGDGDDDLFRATNTIRGNRVTGVQVEVILNDGGTFTAHEPTELDVDVWGVGWFVAGDPDGDGQDEVVVTNGRGGSVGVLEHEDGAFAPPTEWLSGSLGDQEWEEIVFEEGAPWFRQALSDVDGDGDDDLVALARPDEGEVDTGVAMSGGGSFAEYEEWGSFSCGAVDPCPVYELVANVEPSIL